MRDENNIMESFEKALRDSRSNPADDLIKEKDYIIEALNEELRYRSKQKEIDDNNAMVLMEYMKSKIKNLEEDCKTLESNYDILMESTNAEIKRDREVIKTLENDYEELKAKYNALEENRELMGSLDCIKTISNIVETNKVLEKENTTLKLEKEKLEQYKEVLCRKITEMENALVDQKGMKIMYLDATNGKFKKLEEENKELRVSLHNLNKIYIALEEDASTLLKDNEDICSLIEDIINTNTDNNTKATERIKEIIKR